MRRAVSLLSLALAAAVAGCDPGTTDPATTDPVGGQPAAPTSAGRSVSGTFGTYQESPTAVTYDPAIVPAGATVTVAMKATGDGAEITLTVGGLLPNRTYGAHLHSQPCGAKATDAGPHYQHNPDPAASASPPSVDPSYANPQNEVWLDFTTDGTGKASSTSTNRWTAPAGTSRSVVIHAAGTKTGPKEAGTAGARAACLAIPA